MNLVIFPLHYILTLPLYLIYRYFIQIYGIFNHRGKADDFIRDFSGLRLLTILLKSWFAALIKLPLRLKKRKKVLTSKKVSNQEIGAWFRKYYISAKRLILEN